MTKRCCVGSGLCNKIKPVAYSGRPLHKVGAIPDGRGNFVDLFSGYGELYNNVSYSIRKDNVFSYKVTGDEKNVYHCCGSDGIHVYSLDNFYNNGNLSSRWKIDSSSSRGVNNTVKKFSYGEDVEGFKLNGYLNSVDGQDSCYRYGYEPTPFSGFYDCKVYGDFLFSVNGVSGLKVYQFDSDKESATSISSVSIPNTICKNVELIKFGNLVVVCVGTAKYVKPSNSYSYDAFDLPSVPSLDFSDPNSMARLQELGWGGDTGAYTYAMTNGYSSSSSDGFNIINSVGAIEVHCFIFDIKDERWILTPDLEVQKSNSSSFDDLLKVKFYDADQPDSSGEVTSLSCMNLGSEINSDDNIQANFSINYGVAVAGSSIPAGFYALKDVQVITRKVEGSNGSVDVYDIVVPGSGLISEGVEPVLDITNRSGATIFSRYFDGLQGTQSMSGGGMGVQQGNQAGVLYQLLDLQYDYYTSYSTYTYDFYSGFKIDLSSIFLSKSHAFLTLFEGGLLVACRSSAQGATILDWENFDSLSSNLDVDSPQQFLSSLAEGAPSTLSLVDSWSDGNTIFSADCLQYSIAGGPRSFGLYYYPNPDPNGGSPEVQDFRRSYLYRDDGESSSAAAGGLVAFSLVE